MENLERVAVVHSGGETTEYDRAELLDSGVLKVARRVGAAADRAVSGAEVVYEVKYFAPHKWESVEPMSTMSFAESPSGFVDSAFHL
jgi:hypothetical protein